MQYVSNKKLIKVGKKIKFHSISSFEFYAPNNYGCERSSVNEGNQTISFVKCREINN